MELDELKDAWRELAAQVDADQAMYRNLRQEWNRDRTRLELRGVNRLPLVELLTNSVAALLLGSFLAENWSVAQFAIPALVLHIVTIILIGANVWQLAMLGRLDYAEPVILLQRRLTEIRTVRLRMNQGILLLSPLLWTPLAIVAAKGVFHFDIYRAFGPVWIMANLLFGLAAIPLFLWVAHRYADRFAHSPVMQNLADDIAGRRLAAAIVFLDEIAQFEEE